MVNHGPNQETLFLVGSWLRPEDFGFGHTLVSRVSRVSRVSNVTGVSGVSRVSRVVRLSTST